MYNLTFRTLLLFLLLSWDVKIVEGGIVPTQPQAWSCPEMGFSLATANSDHVNLSRQRNKTNNKDTFRLQARETHFLDESIPETSQSSSDESTHFYCSCDLPHTLRCDGAQRNSSRQLTKLILQKITSSLRKLSPNQSISLLDISVQHISYLPNKAFQGLDLRGLVISTGSLQNVSNKAFSGLESDLTALGLPVNRLETLPVAAISSLTGLTKLDLSSNRFTGLYSLPALPDLEYLDLSRNDVRVLASGIFQTLPHLNFLSLSDNQLNNSAIYHYNLQHLSYLDTLDMARNNFTGYMRPPMFDLFPSNLKHLDLSHNLFTGIEENSFKSLIGLQKLILQGNNIQEIGDKAFNGLHQLRTLDLSFNSILTFSDLSFNGLGKLETLLLNSNYIQVISPHWMGSLVSLKNIHLMDNEITYVEDNAFKNLLLDEMDVSGNPLNCDCSLSYFQGWLQDMSNNNFSKTSLSSAICATPPQLNNAPLASIEKPLECSSPSNRTGELEYYEYYSETGLPGSSLAYSSEIKLVGTHYNSNEGILTLKWRIEDSAVPYTCSSINVFQEHNIGVELIAERYLACESEGLTNQNHLETNINVTDFRMVVSVPYIVCIRLLHEVGEIPGCTGSLTIPKQTSAISSEETEVEFHGLEDQVTVASLIANVSLDCSTVEVFVRSIVPTGMARGCRLFLSVAIPGEEDHGLLDVHSHSCEAASDVFTDLPRREVFRICAVIQLDQMTSHLTPHAIPSDSDFNASHNCILALAPRVRYQDRSVLPLLLTLIFLALGIGCLTVLYLIVKRNRSDSRNHRGQVFGRSWYRMLGQIKWTFTNRRTHVFLNQTEQDF